MLLSLSTADASAGTDRAPCELRGTETSHPTSTHMTRIKNALCNKNSQPILQSFYGAEIWMEHVPLNSCPAHPVTETSLHQT